MRCPVGRPSCSTSRPARQVSRGQQLTRHLAGALGGQQAVLDRAHADADLVHVGGLAHAGFILVLRVVLDFGHVFEVALQNLDVLLVDQDGVVGVDHVLLHGQLGADALLLGELGGQLADLNAHYRLRIERPAGGGHDVRSIFHLDLHAAHVEALAEVGGVAQLGRQLRPACRRRLAYLLFVDFDVFLRSLELFAVFDSMVHCFFQRQLQGLIRRCLLLLGCHCNRQQHQHRHFKNLFFHLLF